MTDASFNSSPEKLPKHIAIIMDGNGRWARSRDLKNSEGHKAGIAPLRSVIENCAEFGVEALTVFAFSSENWQRPDEEVNALMGLFIESLSREIDELHAKGVQFRVIGSRDRFDGDLKQRMTHCEDLTKANTRLVLSIALDYGGRWDIAQAAKAMATAVSEGELEPDNISEDTLSKYICNSDLVDPDLCIRTGGDYRISNFLLWQFAYTELYVTDCLWPDFDRNQFELALTEYQARQRRFGKSGDQL